MSYHGSKHNSKDNLSVMFLFQVLECCMMQIFPLWFFIIIVKELSFHVCIHYVSTLG